MSPRQQRRDSHPRRRALLALAGAAALLLGAGVVLVATRGHATRGRPAAIAPGAVSPAPLGAPARPPPGSEQFGISVNRLFNDRAYTQTQLDAQLRALRQTGATLARSDALWEATEPKPPVDGVHHYEWAFDDSIAGALASHGLRWLAIIDYSAPWAQSTVGQEHSPPRTASDYAAFAGAFAARYGLGGSFWRAHPTLTPRPVDTYEIWNEPDNPAFWVPTPDASRYVDLYLRARQAIELVDPGAHVIVGGLTAPTNFLRAMLKGRPDLRGHLDGVAIHPYGVDPQAVLRAVGSAQAGLASLTLAAVPLYVTEFGWTTLPVGALSWAPARLRPSYISSTLSALGHLDCPLAAVVLYTWVTPRRDPHNREDWFGVHPPSDPRPGDVNPDTEAVISGLREGVQSAPRIRACAGAAH